MDSACSSGAGSAWPQVSLSMNRSMSIFGYLRVCNLFGIRGGFYLAIVFVVLNRCLNWVKEFGIPVDFLYRRVAWEDV